MENRFGIKIRRGGKFTAYGTNKNVIIKGGYIENQGEISMKEARNQDSAFINKAGGKAKIEDFDTDSTIVNEGLFIGKRIKVFLKKQWPILTILSVLVTIISILLTIVSILKK